MRGVGHLVVSGVMVHLALYRLRVDGLRIRRRVVEIALAAAHMAQRAEVHVLLCARTEGTSSTLGLAHVARTVAGWD